MNIFTYGTLMNEPIWNNIVKNRYNYIETYLYNYIRLRLKDKDYPGLVKRNGAVTKGILYFNLNQDDIERLDNFEGEEYKRIPVETFTENNENYFAYTYLYNNKYCSSLIESEWSYKEFLEENIENFKKNYYGWNKI